LKHPVRSIAVVTGSRADFGLLQPVMRAIDGHRRLQLQTVVTGAHLATGTWCDVRHAGFKIMAKVLMQRPNATGRAADAAALGKGIIGLGRALVALDPHIVLVLGDRIEALAAACAASVGGIHLAHIHGGDRGQGVADESMRHAISKLAHLHFPATNQSKKRLIRMGEAPNTVYNLGSPAADELGQVTPATDAPELIILQHPIGGTYKQEFRWMHQTLLATAKFNRLVLAPNLDPGSDGVRAALSQSPVKVIDHLSRDQFLARLARARAIVGNSSAGLIEAAVLKRACVNIGPRQDGREKPRNVIDCHYGQRPVRAAVQQALKLNLTSMRHPYGQGNTGQQIADQLAKIDLSRVPIYKQNAY